MSKLGYDPAAAAVAECLYLRGIKSFGAAIMDLMERREALTALIGHEPDGQTRTELSLYQEALDYVINVDVAQIALGIKKGLEDAIQGLELPGDPVDEQTELLN